MNGICIDKTCTKCFSELNENKEDFIFSFPEIFDCTHPDFICPDCGAQLEEYKVKEIKEPFIEKGKLIKGGVILIALLLIGGIFSLFYFNIIRLPKWVTGGEKEVVINTDTIEKAPEYEKIEWINPPIGRLTYRNAIYNGVIVNGKRNGKGELEFIKGVLKGKVIKGEWKDDIKIGEFTGFDENNIEYKGTFNDGKGVMRGIRNPENELIHFAQRFKGE